MRKTLTGAFLYEETYIFKKRYSWHHKCKQEDESSMSLKKQYIFSKTLSAVAAVIAKVRLMQVLTDKEELIYFIEVKGMSKESAEKFIKKKKTT